MYKKGYQNAAPVSKYAAKKNSRFAQVQNLTKEGSINVSDEDRAFKSKRDILIEKYGEATVDLASIVVNNAEIRRFTALGILNYLSQKGMIKGTKKYVRFNWNKFSVICDGLSRDYTYDELFFINSLVAAFASFSASAQNTIDIFCQEVMNNRLGKVANKEEVDAIVAANEEHINYKEEVEQSAGNTEPTGEK